MHVSSPPHDVMDVVATVRNRGFTLIELLVTMIVAVVLMLFAIPSFKNIINSYRLDAAANAMIASLNTARMAAIQQNTSAQFCSNAAGTNTTSALGTKCGTDTGAVYALATSSSTAVQLAQPPPQLGISTIQIHGTVAAIRYNSQGLGYAAGSTTPFDSSTNGAVVDICSTALSTNNHVQINMAAGSIISTLPSTGTCP